MAMTWIVRLGLVLAAVVLLPMAGASAQTCSVTSMSDFGSTTVNIVPNATATASGQVTYRCTSLVPFSSVRICAYIRTTSVNQVRDAYSYYQTKDIDSRLAWEARENYGRLYARDGGGSVSTGGIRMFFSGGTGLGTDVSGQNTITLTYLTRQLQDRVRSGIYSGSSYQLVSQYKFNTTQACETGLTGLTGTIVTPFTVTANVPVACQFENFTDVDFGSRGSVTLANSSSTVRAFGNVGVRCTYQTPYSITIANGLNYAGGTRRVRSGSNYIGYTLFQPGCSVPWTTTSAVTGTGATVNLLTNHQVCGQVTTPVSVAPAAGTYVDTVVVTVTF